MSEEQLKKTGDFRCSGSLCENLHCSWKVPDFSSLEQAVGSYYECDPIPSMEESDVRWYMLLYPGGTESEHEGTVQCYFGCENKLEVSLRAKLSFSMWSSDGELIAGSPDPKEMNFKTGMLCDLLEIERFTLLDRIEDDIVIIIAELVYSRSIVKACETTRILDHEHPCVALSNDYFNLRDRMETDVVIVVGADRIRAHSAVLSARSISFAELLQHDTEGTIPRRIEIFDYPFDVVESMILFIYAGEVDELSVPLALGLLEIGDKYKLDSLISHCTTFLVAQLDECNALDVILQAYNVRSCPVLRAHATRYISERVSAADFKEKFTGLKSNGIILYHILLHMLELDDPT